MKVLFFAQARQLSGCGEVELVTAQSLTSDELWRRLDEMFPGLAMIRATTRLARNHEYSTAYDRFENHDIVALIPPVSGG